MDARLKTSREPALSHHVSHLTNSQNLPTVTSEYFLTIFRVFTLILLMCVQIRVLLCVYSWLWHMKSRNDTGYPRPLAGPPGLSPRPPHEVDKRHRLSKASPPPTRSRQKTQAIRHGIHRLRVSFREGRARPGEAGREAGRSTQADPHSYTKRLWAGANAPARSPLIKTLS